MSDLSRQNDGTAAIIVNTENSLSQSAGYKASGRIAVPVLQNIPSRPRVHKEKVLAVKQQLVEGRYQEFLILWEQLAPLAHFSQDCRSYILNPNV